MIDLRSLIHWPNTPNSNSTAAGQNLTWGTLTGAGHWVGAALQAVEDMVISHVLFVVNSAAGSPAVDVRIETVDLANSGRPSGALYAAGANVVTGALSTGPQVVALTTPVVIPRGAHFALRIAYDSGTSVALNSTNGTISSILHARYPITSRDVAGFANVQTYLDAAFGSSATTFYRHPLCWPVLGGSSNSLAVNNSGTHRACGAYFTPEFKCRACGLKVNLQGTNADYTIEMQDAAGSVLNGSTSPTFDGSSTASQQGNLVFFSAPVVLTPGTWYRAVVTPVSASNVTNYYASVSDGNVRAIWPVADQNWRFTRFSSGAWVNLADTIAHMALLIDQIDDGIGSGGGGEHFSVFMA